MTSVGFFLIDTIYTIPNSGGITDLDGTKHSSACMWITIKNYLQIFRGITISVGQLKREAGFTSLTDDFNFDIRAHVQALHKVIHHYKLCYRIYRLLPRDNKMGVSNEYNPESGNCPGDPPLKIIANGAHFELFIFRDEIDTIEENYRLLFRGYVQKIKSGEGYLSSEQVEKMTYSEQIAKALELSLKKTRGEPGVAIQATEEELEELENIIKNITKLQNNTIINIDMYKRTNDKITLEQRNNSLITELTKKRDQYFKEGQDSNKKLILLRKQLVTAIGRLNRDELLKQIGEKIDKVESSIRGYTKMIDTYSAYIGTANKQLKERRLLFEGYLKTYQDKLIVLRELQNFVNSEIKLEGGHKHPDDNNRRKYLKYKFKYLQLKQK